MASPSYNNLFDLVTIILCLAVSCRGDRTTKQDNQHKMLFVFGDSLFDAGNNQYLTNDTDRNLPGYSWPYGMSVQNLTTGRVSDGILVPDFIALAAKLNVVPPVMQPGANFSDGVSFASAGGGVQDKNNGVMNLRTQLEKFKTVVALLEQKVGKAEAKQALMRSVYLFSLGGVDYFSFNGEHPNATDSEKRAHIQSVVRNLTNGIREIYDMGARKIAFQNVGPLGCYQMTKLQHPESMDACVQSLESQATQHNNALRNALDKLSKRLPGFKHSIFDYQHALKDRILNPAKYGFKVGQVACIGTTVCKNPDEYVLFDGSHHTQKANQQLAQLLWSGKPDTTGPYNMMQLFAFA